MQYLYTILSSKRNIYCVRENKDRKLYLLVYEKTSYFVTILENGKLKGCIGTYQAARENTALEIIQNAIKEQVAICKFKAKKYS